eukprot:Nk52_evm47s158 gene=Nk52_evmTU47s158
MISEEGLLNTVQALKTKIKSGKLLQVEPLLAAEIALHPDKAILYWLGFDTAIRKSTSDLREARGWERGKGTRINATATYQKEKETGSMSNVFQSGNEEEAAHILGRIIDTFIEIQVKRDPFSSDPLVDKSIPVAIKGIKGDDNRDCVVDCILLLLQQSLWVPEELERRAEIGEQEKGRLCCDCFMGFPVEESECKKGEEMGKTPGYDSNTMILHGSVTRGAYDLLKSVLRHCTASTRKRFFMIAVASVLEKDMPSLSNLSAFVKRCRFCSCLIRCFDIQDLPMGMIVKFVIGGVRNTTSSSSRAETISGKGGDGYWEILSSFHKQKSQMLKLHQYLNCIVDATVRLLCKSVASAAPENSNLHILEIVKLICMVGYFDVAILSSHRKVEEDTSTSWNDGGGKPMLDMDSTRKWFKSLGGILASLKCRMETNGANSVINDDEKNCYDEGMLLDIVEAYALIDLDRFGDLLGNLLLDSQASGGESAIKAAVVDFVTFCYIHSAACFYHFCYFWDNKSQRMNAMLAVDTSGFSLFEYLAFQGAEAGLVSTRTAKRRRVAAEAATGPDNGNGSLFKSKLKVSGGERNGVEFWSVLSRCASCLKFCVIISNLYAREKSLGVSDSFSKTFTQACNVLYISTEPWFRICKADVHLSELQTSECIECCKSLLSEQILGVNGLKEHPPLSSNCHSPLVPISLQEAGLLVRIAQCFLLQNKVSNSLFIIVKLLQTLLAFDRLSVCDVLRNNDLLNYEKLCSGNDEKNILNTHFVQLDRRSLVSFCLQHLVRCFEVEVHQHARNCTDGELGRLTIAVQFVWKRHKDVFLKNVVPRLQWRSNGTFTFPYFLKYLFILDILEEFAYLVNNGSIEMMLFGKNVDEGGISPSSREDYDPYSSLSAEERKLKTRKLIEKQISNIDWTLSSEKNNAYSILEAFLYDEEHRLKAKTSK